MCVDNSLKIAFDNVLKKARIWKQVLQYSQLGPVSELARFSLSLVVDYVQV